MNNGMTQPRIFLLLIFLLPFARVDSCHGAFEKGNTGARLDALGGTFSSSVNDEYAVFYNPAGLSLLTDRVLSFSYSRPHGIKELQRYSGVVAFPNRKAVLAAAWSHSGFSLYREESLHVSAGAALGKRIRAGATIKYHHLSIARHGERGMPDTDAGFLYYLHDSWILGGAVSNVAGHTIGAIPVVPRSAAFGCSFRKSSRTMLSLDCESDDMKRVFLSFGSELSVDNLRLRLGYRDREKTLSGGLGIYIRIFAVDYALLYHASLGATHSVTFTWWP